MAETDKSQVAGEGREPGFYWVRDARVRANDRPSVCEWIVSKLTVKSGMTVTTSWWAYPGPRREDLDDAEFTVLSPRLEPPK